MHTWQVFITCVLYVVPLSLGEGPGVGVPAIPMAGTTPHPTFSFTGPFSLGEGPEVGVPAISMAGTTPHLNFSFTGSYTNIPNYNLFIQTQNLVRCQKIQFINKGFGLKFLKATRECGESTLGSVSTPSKVIHYPRSGGYINTDREGSQLWYSGHAPHPGNPYAQFILYCETM